MNRCRNCNVDKLCKAHLIPKSIAREVSKTGDQKLHLVDPDRKGSLQGGLFDTQILCADCDNFLGKYDNYALKILRLVGSAQEEIDYRDQKFILSSDKVIDHEKLALFAASVAWRYSVSRTSDFCLGNNEDWLKDIVFRKIEEIPAVSIFRIVSQSKNLNPHVHKWFSYPIRLKNEKNISFAKFHTAGLMFVIKTSKQKSYLGGAANISNQCLSREANKLVGPLLDFEELDEKIDVLNSRYMKERFSENRS